MHFLFTMNMESVNERAIHQVIGEHPARSCEELADAMNKTDYLRVRQYYKTKFPEPKLEDKGDLILNCSLIGKVIEYRLDVDEPRREYAEATVKRTTRKY